MYICIYWRYSIFEGDLGGHVKQTPAERHQVRSGPAPPLLLLHCLTALCEVWLKSRPRGSPTCLTLKYLGAINYTKASLSNYHHEYSNTKTTININHHCHYVYFFFTTKVSRYCYFKLDCTNLQFFNFQQLEIESRIHSILPHYQMPM